MTAEVAYLYPILELSDMSAVDSWNSWNAPVDLSAQWHDVVREMQALWAFKNNNEGCCRASMREGFKIIDGVEQSEMWRKRGLQEIQIRT
jgi:hypothetical protein